jgi:hypothetical protein
MSETKKDVFLTEADCREVQRDLTRKYAGTIKDRYFEVVATRDARGAYATVTLRNRSGSFFYPVEGRIAHHDHDLSSRDAGLLLLESIDAYFDEYLRDGDVYLPIDWSEFEVDGVPFQLKGQILNLMVERMADELLAREGGMAKDVLLD